MKLLPMSQGYETMVDDDVYEWAKKDTWCAKKDKHTTYARRYEGSGDNQKVIYLHREIMGTPSGEDCDHKDGNGLNNQRSNIRNATRSQNQMNSRKVVSQNGKATSSRYKGVYWNKHGGEWKAGIQIRGKTIHLGRFVSEKDAARAYDKEATRLFGEFAKVNAVVHLELGGT